MQTTGRSCRRHSKQSETSRIASRLFLEILIKIWNKIYEKQNLSLPESCVFLLQMPFDLFRFHMYHSSKIARLSKRTFSHVTHPSPNWQEDPSKFAPHDLHLPVTSTAVLRGLIYSNWLNYLFLCTWPSVSCAKGRWCPRGEELNCIAATACSYFPLLPLLSMIRFRVLRRNETPRKT